MQERQHEYNKQSMLKKSVVTGMGACSAGGIDLRALWNNTLQGKVAASMEFFPPLKDPLPVYRASLPDSTNKSQNLLRQADRSVHLALRAASEAWKQAGLDIAKIKPERLGVVIGSARGPVTFQEQSFALSLQAEKKSRPSTSLYTAFSSISGMIAKTFQAEGPAFVVSSSCTSGATALHAASGMIQSGLIDAVIVGGVDAPLTPTLLEQYYQTGILSACKIARDALSPFDLNRSGTVLGEGAAFVILESDALARARKATILGCLDAVLLGSQGRHRTGIDHEGLSLQKILRYCLKEAELLPGDVDLLHLHGTGTRLNDLQESQAVALVFGNLKEQPYTCATKSITGHTLGAAPIFQLVLTLCAMRDGIIPPLTNTNDLDPACTLRFVLTKTQRHSLSKALCLTAGFWGNVASMIVSTSPLAP
jgi:3-oxoacyl-(acyl-carrier-protein) synthase